MKLTGYYITVSNIFTSSEPGRGLLLMVYAHETLDLNTTLFSVHFNGLLTPHRYFSLATANYPSTNLQDCLFKELEWLSSVCPDKLQKRSDHCASYSTVR
jgi:hypothetical protein